MTTIIDVHQHVGPWPFPGRWGGIELNLEYMEKRGIDVAIISSTEAIVDDMLAGNARLAQDLEGHPNLLGYVTLNPRFPALSAREMETYAGHPNSSGTKSTQTIRARRWASRVWPTSLPPWPSLRARS